MNAEASLSEVPLAEDAGSSGTAGAYGSSSPAPLPKAPVPALSQPAAPVASGVNPKKKLNRSSYLWTYASATTGQHGKQFQFVDQLGKNHKVVLKHHTVTGELDVLLDGDELLAVVTDLTVGNWSDEHFKGYVNFECQGQLGRVEWMVRKDGWGPVPTRFGYCCIFNDEPVQDDSSKRATTKRGEDLKVWITTAETTGGGVVWYRIDTKVQSTGMEVAVHRRFSDFYFLYTSLSIYFKGSHLLHALPEPPPKGFKLWQDQHDKEFIENRRAQLEAFLRKIIMVPRVAELQELYDILGIVNETIRETSMIFSQGPLGLTLRAQKSGGASEAIVADFKPNADGVYGPAKNSGLISIGDCVSKIDGESVFEDPYDVIVEKVKAAQRPVLIHFLGYCNNGVDDEDEQAEEK